MSEFKNVPLQPTEEMIDQGAQRLVSWEDGCKWPDSWSRLQVSAARTEAERIWRSMWCESSSAPTCSTAKFNYVDVVGKGCEGWLNLFFGDHCIALVNNQSLADEIRRAIKPRSR